MRGGYKGFLYIVQYGRRWLREADFGPFGPMMCGLIMAAWPRSVAAEVALKIGLFNRLQVFGAGRQPMPSDRLERIGRCGAAKAMPPL